MRKLRIVNLIHPVDAHYQSCAHLRLPPAHPHSIDQQLNTPFHNVRLSRSVSLPAALHPPHPPPRLPLTIPVRFIGDHLSCPLTGLSTDQSGGVKLFIFDLCSRQTRMFAIPASKRYAIPQYHPCDSRLPHPNLSRYSCPLPTNQFIQWDGIMRTNAAKSNWNSADRDNYRSSSAKQRNSSKPGNTPILTAILLPRAVRSFSTYPMSMGCLFSRS